MTDKKYTKSNTQQSSSKRTISKEDWEKRLSEVRIGKEEMNRLIMNFFVTEVCVFWLYTVEETQW